MLFKDYYQKAPQKIQETVDSFGTAEALAQIAADHSVDDNKGVGNRDLGRLTGQVLVGMLHPKDFVPALVEKLEIPKERAQKIAKEVNQKIFSQVKDLLIELHGLKKEEKAIHQSLSTPAKPVATENSETKPSSATNLPAGRQGFGEVKSSSLEGAVVKSTSTKSPNVIKKVNLPVPQKPSLPLPKKEVEKSPVLEPVVPKPAFAQSLSADRQSSGKTKPTSATNLPAERKGSGEAKPKNPFEEKLRQTFTIPEENSIPKPPTAPSLNQDEKIKNIGTEKKKEKIKNNPYLETIE